MENENQTQQGQPPQKAEVMIVDGVMVPRTLEEAYRASKILAASGMLPARYKTPESVFAGMQLAAELGLKPVTGLRQIAVINGTPGIFGDLPLALVQRSGLLKSIDEYLVTKEGVRIEENDTSSKPFQAVCIVERKGDPNPCKRTFNLDEAQQAGLLGSPTWKSYTKTMLKYRARSQALKDKFPDCLNGIAIAEYDFHVLPGEQGIEEAVIAASPAEELQKRFAIEPEIVEDKE